MYSYEYFSRGPSATMSLGKRLGELLGQGSVIALIGELGCGKTLLTRGICAGLEVPPRLVNSPTFVLVNEYPGRLHVFHMDFYRLEEASDGVEIGLLDYLARTEAGVLIVEWAERVISVLPEDLLKVEFEVLSARKRRIKFTAYGERFVCLLRELRRSC
ncbi:MAG: tRNA (adenosine(37)-N6)-threonylcarbamoyltransferase complex ATPase subunit type 1 TsaE [Chloroflexota bacterium]